MVAILLFWRTWRHVNALYFLIPYHHPQNPTTPHHPPPPPTTRDILIAGWKEIFFTFIRSSYSVSLGIKLTGGKVKVPNWPPVNPFLPDILSDFLILGRTSCCRQLVFWTIDQVTGYFLKCSDITIIFYTNWLFFGYKKCGNTVIFTQETQTVSSSKLRPDNFRFLKGLNFLTTMIFLCLCTTNSQATKTSQLTGGRLVNFMCKRRF